MCSQNYAMAPLGQSGTCSKRPSGKDSPRQLRGVSSAREIVVPNQELSPRSQYILCSRLRFPMSKR